MYLQKKRMKKDVYKRQVYGVSMAFCTALIRNLLGTGSLLAFPGSMVGAFVSAMIFKYTRSKIGAYLGEVIGTGILGGMLCYPIASMMMGQKAALFTFVGPFLASTLCGTVIAAVIITALYKSKAVSYTHLDVYKRQYERCPVYRYRNLSRSCR